MVLNLFYDYLRVSIFPFNYFITHQFEEVELSLFAYQFTMRLIERNQTVRAKVYAHLPFRRFPKTIPDSLIKVNSPNTRW